MISLKIVDGGGSGEATLVLDGALLVTQCIDPPLRKQKNKIMRQYLTTDGSKTGSKNMGVNGSVTNVEFYIPASPDNDRYITALSFLIAGTSATLSEFGTGPALTNGCVLEYNRSNEIIVIHDSLKTNWDFVRLCMGAPAFGTGADTFLASNVSGSSEAYIPTFNLNVLLPPYGLKLDAGTQQKLTLRIRDNCSNVANIAQFDCIAYGFEREP